MKTVFVLMIWLTAFPVMLQGQENKPLPTIAWNGYIQVRGSSNFEDYTSFALRRLKLWVYSTPSFSPHWSYKLQVTFTSFLQEKFLLQDVKIRYKKGLFSFSLGQFVPQYSLQRFQHDYLIPPLERARVVNTLIPDGTLGVRDLGIQGELHTRDGRLQTYLGLFNGYGIKDYRFANRGFMITHKTIFSLPFGANELKTGYSLQYRYADQLQIRYVLPDSVLFTGNDLRYNFFAMVKNRRFLIQAEYLNAGLEGEHAYGYYLLSAINAGKNQFVLSYGEYHDLIAQTSDRPTCRVGYNYLFRDYKIKLSFDNYFQLATGGIEKYLATLQLQFFLNQN